MAECHPVAFQWVMEAKRQGAKIIHVDPRFTRTSAVSDLHVPLRAGSDIAFLGGLINYIISNKRYFEDYVVNYTNASTIVTDAFRDTEDLDGLFSGWDAHGHRYDTESWSYQDVELPPAADEREVSSNDRSSNRGPQPERPQNDKSLQHERCIFQILRRHFSRYTPEMVEQICGVPQDLFLEVARILCDNSGPERTGAFCYAVGWTQHSVGVQYIRAASIIQLLLGNIGRPGGGILALRGHATIQGSTDVPTLYNLLPGYMPMPKAATDGRFEDWVSRAQPASGWWANFPKYAVSLLKAWFGDAATKDNDWLYECIPRLSGDHSHHSTVANMADGKLRGYFVMGENPTVGSMNGAFQRKGLRQLEWLVVRDFAPTETAEFWRSAPEIDRGDVRPEDIGTEVFFFPCAAHTEKDGTFTNTQRLLQWHHAAVAPPGDCRSELHFMYHLGRRLKKLYADSSDPKDAGIKNLVWDYPTRGDHDEPEAESVVREINGYRVGDGKPVSGFVDLEADGSTACGCWIYSGSFRDRVNQAARRKPGREQNWVASEWGWAWPNNRRILYNRASADPEGKPWSERKRYVWWDEKSGRWTGFDNPDFIPDRPPTYEPAPDAYGVDAISGRDPFIMQADGKAWLYAPNGLLDGPLPTHYEPQEGVVQNPLYAQQCSPARMEWHRRENPYHQPWDDPRFPYVLTTYRLTEHHTAGGMSRWLSWLSELQPEMFCEVSPELARERRLRNGAWATISTARAEIEARVLVTERIKALNLGGRVVHQIGLPYHWGGKGLVRGDAANELISFVADPNVSIQESKCFTGNIEPGRRSKLRRAATGSMPADEEEFVRRHFRDLHAEQRQPEGAHDAKSPESQEGSQA
jgi:formate dehydrogenase major subunit